VQRNKPCRELIKDFMMYVAQKAVSRKAIEQSNIK